MKRIILTLAAALAAILIVLAVSATRPAHAGKPVASGTIVLDQAAPALGDWVTFTTTTANLGGQNPRVEIDCYQAVPFDYSWPDGSVHTQTDPLVFASAAPANDAQLLGGGGSVWLYHGGPAECVATLYYWDFHPVQTFVPLASISFSAGG